MLTLCFLSRFRYIIPPSISLNVPLKDRIDLKSLATLRALSQTWWLRELILPLVSTPVSQLGKLRELLRTSPSIAKFVTLLSLGF